MAATLRAFIVMFFVNGVLYELLRAVLGTSSPLIVVGISIWMAAGYVIVYRTVPQAQTVKEAIKGTIMATV